MKVYLDVCCLSRLTDDQSQKRVRLEAAAIEQILDRVQSGGLEWTVSAALLEEIGQNPSVELRLKPSRSSPSLQRLSQ